MCYALSFRKVAHALKPQLRELFKRIRSRQSIADMSQRQAHEQENTGSLLDIQLLPFLCKMFAGPHGKRQNRHGGILPSGGCEYGSIHHEKILVIVALVPLVQDALLRI